MSSVVWLMGSEPTTRRPEQVLKPGPLFLRSDVLSTELPGAPKYVLLLRQLKEQPLLGFLMCVIE